jgi:fibro-slime domain-containing protein
MAQLSAQMRVCRAIGLRRRICIRSSASLEALAEEAKGSYADMTLTRFAPPGFRSQVALPFGVACAAMLLAMPSPTMAAPEDEDPPETVEVTGIVRDFIERTKQDGHIDFEVRPSEGFGHYTGSIAYELGLDRKPVYTGEGYKITSQWRDSEHRQICYLLYDPMLGDVEGSFGSPSDGGVASAESFNMWFNDTPGVNLSKQLSLTLVRQADGQYVFDDRYDPLYADLGGFFPIDDQLFGNSGGSPDHNFHFTFELHLSFKYNESADQFFKFIGDDDVWIFIDGKLAVDLGGVHAAHDQYIDLNRLGLTDGYTYNIDFFYAERHRPYASFRIETNIPVDSWVPGTITDPFD